MADKGRDGDIYFDKPILTEALKMALHDGARLQSLELRDIYAILIKKRLQNQDIVLHPEKLEDSKETLAYETNLKPTNETILRSVWKLPLYPRIRDHIWSLSMGRMKIGDFWRHIPNLEDRTYCKPCEVHGYRHCPETPQHLWIECEYNSQRKAWQFARHIWQKSSQVPWPQTSIGLLAGSPAISLKERNGSESESKRMRIIIATTTWAIWKTRNKLTINDIPIRDTDAAELTKDLLTEMITKAWNATKLAKINAKEKKRNALMNLWGDKLVSWPQSEGKPLSFGF